MQNPHNQPSLLGHNVHGTTLALTSSGLGPNHSENNTFSNNHDLVDATLSFNSAAPFPSQNQAFPVLNQPSSHHHMGEARNRSANPIAPFGLHAHQTSDSYTLGPQNTINLNFIVGNNSSINVNLFSNKPCYQLARNSPFAPSSNIPLVRNNVYNPASSNFQRQLSTLASHQKPMVNRIPETHDPPQFTRHHSRYVSSTVSTASRMILSTLQSAVIPCLSQNTDSLSPLQGHPSNSCPIISCQNHIFFQSGMDLSSTNQPSRYSPIEKHSHLPAFPSSISNPKMNQVLAPGGGHGILHKNSVHTRPNLPAPESHTVKEVSKSKQAPEPNSNHNPLPQPENLQVLSPVPSQNDKESATIELDPQARKCHRSPMRYKSHPYKKYGPYTCPQCHVIFDNGYRYAAHYKSHYKDETVAEKKKRQESKIRNKDLHIARCMDGITVMPGSPQLEDEPLAAADIADGKTDKCNHGQNFATLVIKEEVIIKEEAMKHN